MVLEVLLLLKLISSVNKAEEIQAFFKTDEVWINDMKFLFTHFHSHWTAALNE